MGRGQGIQAAGSHTRRGFVTVAGSDGIKWEVRPGVFDDDAREACVLGQCHALALALNRRFSWPLVGAFDELEDLVHVAAVCPDGRILDAEGYYSGEDHFRLAYNETATWGGEEDAYDVRAVAVEDCYAVNALDI